MKHRRLSFFLAILLFNSSLIFSQKIEISDSSKNYDNHAIQFYIVDQVNLAYKYYFLEKSSLRFVVNYSNDFTDDEEENDNYDYNDKVITVNTETETNNQFLEFKIQYLHDVSVNKILNVFLGVGIFTNNQYNSIKDKSERFDDGNLEYVGSYKTTTNIWRIGAGIVFGLECNLYKSVTMFSEYEVVLHKGWKTWRFGNDYRSKQENTEWGYKLNGIKLGIGISF